MKLHLHHLRLREALFPSHDLDVMAALLQPGLSEKYTFEIHQGYSKPVLTIKERLVFLNQLPETTHSNADALPSLKDNQTFVHRVDYCFLPLTCLEFAVKNPIEGKGVAGASGSLAAVEDPLSHISKVMAGWLQRSLVQGGASAGRSCQLAPHRPPHQLTVSQSRDALNSHNIINVKNTGFRSWGKVNSEEHCLEG